MSKTTKRCLGVLAGLAATAAVVTAVTLVVRRERAAQRYAAAAARLDADDPYWRLDDLLKSLQGEPLDDADNLAVSLAALTATHRRRDADIIARRAELVIDLVPNVRLTRGQWRAVIDSIEADESWVTPALDLDRYPRGRHAIAYTADVVSTRLPHFERLGWAAEMLDDLHLSAVQRGDAATALRAFRATLNLGRSVREEPARRSQISRTWRRRTAVRGLERLLGHVELTGAQLAEVERELRTELAEDLALVVARGELAMLDRVLSTFRAGAITAAQVSVFRPDPPPAPPAPLGRALDWVRGQVGVDALAEHAVLLDIEARSVAAARLSWPERRAALQALPGRDDVTQPELVRWLTPNFAELFGPYALDEARARCALAAVAVERHRLARGDWPASLADVGPLPEDPFTGKPLGYKRLADGVVVYSVGSDGTDDGGELTETSRHQTRPGSDFGVRLWDVPRRNQPPTRGEP